MKGPKDFEEELTPEDLVQVEELERDLEAWFDAKHEEADYNMNVPENRQYPWRVWEELARRASKAGWVVELRGAMLTVKCPRRV